MLPSSPPPPSSSSGKSVGWRAFFLHKIHSFWPACSLENVDGLATCCRIALQVVFCKVLSILLLPFAGTCLLGFRTGHATRARSISSHNCVCLFVYFIIYVSFLGAQIEHTDCKKGTKYNHLERTSAKLWWGATGGYLQMNWLSLRNNWLKFEIVGRLPIVLEGFIEYTTSISGRGAEGSRHVTGWTCKH